jgi:hypothetical protein
MLEEMESRIHGNSIYYVRGTLHQTLEDVSSAELFIPWQIDNEFNKVVYILNWFSLFLTFSILMLLNRNLNVPATWSDQQQML